MIASQKLRDQERELLIRKYGNFEIANKIMEGEFWQGQTQEQLIDSLGEPIEVDQKVTKRKTIEVWKYEQTGRGRFALRIRLENGIVVGWDDKT